MRNNTNTSDPDSDEFIGTVDVWQLNVFRRPIMRALMPGYVDQLELHRHLKDLLASGHWRKVHVVRHVDAHHPYPHLFDVYGQPI